MMRRLLGADSLRSDNADRRAARRRPAATLTNAGAANDVTVFDACGG
jgi:hypothetical protein